ncbi:MAG TPA: hypothetical protein VI685_29210 [Candidatus Angelobacter sp.]
MKKKKDKIRRQLEEAYSPKEGSELSEMREAVSLMKRSQEVQRERIEPLFRHKAYVAIHS